MSMDAMNTILSMSTSSTAHIFGNVTRAMELYLAQHMPRGMLKETSISTRAPFKYLSVFTNTNRELPKKKFPCMIIRPHFENLSPNDDIFLQGTSLTRYEGTLVNSRQSIQEFLKDKDHGFALGFRINRTRVTFDVQLTFRSYLMALDIKNYLYNTFRWEMPEYLPTSLESLIPKETIVYTAACLGIDISKKEQLPIFLKYLNDKSTYPITYKMQDSTSNDAYFLFYNQNILTTFTDLDLEESQKRGMIDDNTSITFKVSCDFNTIGTYLMYGLKETFHTIKFGIVSGYDRKDFMSTGTYTPIFTYTRIAEDNTLIANGYSRTSAFIIKSSPELVGISDVSAIDTLFDPFAKSMINKMISTNGKPDLLFKTLVYCDNNLITENVDYNLDWNRLTVTINNSDKFATYRVILYCNLSLYNAHKLDSMNLTDQQTISKDSNTGY